MYERLFRCKNLVNSTSKIRFCSSSSIPEPQYDTLGTALQFYHHSRPFSMKYGELPSYTLAYETWGKMNPEKDNVILLFPGLSASSHAASSSLDQTKGWWEEYIGPGKALDTNRFHIICCNSLGGCHGSSGPAQSGPTFPQVSLDDIVRSQMNLLENLEISKLHSVVGSSMGGMLSLNAAALFPEKVQRCVSISSCGRSYPSSIAIRYCQRQVLMADQNWNEGNYTEDTFPVEGMRRAREIGTISYRSGPEWDQRFGRRRKQPDSVPSAQKADFLIEHYLEHQGEKWMSARNRFDPNSYLNLSKAMDLFDLSVDGDYEKGIGRITAQTLIMGVMSDILFPSWQQREIAKILQKTGRECIYYELDSIHGHDTFLVDVPTVSAAVKGYLETN